jgi:hypothetical protein
MQLLHDTHVWKTAQLTNLQTSEFDCKSSNLFTTNITKAHTYLDKDVSIQNLLSKNAAH